ncbi:uncharacterized protein LOC115261990 [Aedes albopictus]|uniref:PHD-type domain-containing protein n=1 Tax=Aedes albopictus TaxID=7160 RepID=A0ABM1YH39_AEDAL
MRKASLAIPATESNCVACDRSDDADNMVQCDACDTWWHFSCAKVTASISNRAWVCSKCTKDDSLSFKSGLSDRSGSQLAESMARLKERQELEKKRLELDLQKKFLDEQQRLLDATVTAVSGSLKSCVTRRESTQRVEEWICRTAEQKAFEESDREPVDPLRLQLVQGLAVTERYGAPIEMMRHVQKRSESDTDELQKLQRQMEECQKKIAVLKITAQSDYPSAVGQQYAHENRRDHFVRDCDGTGQQRTDRTLFDCRTNDEQRQREHVDFATDGQQRYDRAPNEATVNRHQNNAHLDSTVQDQQPEIHSRRQFRDVSLQGPTPQQITARQSLARDLPTFSGDPSEWPIFISNYNYTTAINSRDSSITAWQSKNFVSILKQRMSTHISLTQHCYKSWLVSYLPVKS